MGKWLEKKLRLISKFLTSKPEKQTITIHILLNISKRKSNLTMKYGQLIEYNETNTFLQTSWRK